MILIPEVDRQIKKVSDVLKEIERKLDIVEKHLPVSGSNANVFANSIFSSSNYTQMYEYLKSSSNVSQIITLPSVSNT